MLCRVNFEWKKKNLIKNASYNNSLFQRHIWYWNILEKGSRLNHQIKMICLICSHGISLVGDKKERCEATQEKQTLAFASMGSKRLTKTREAFIPEQKMGFVITSDQVGDRCCGWSSFWFGFTYDLIFYFLKYHSLLKTYSVKHIYDS